MTNLDGFNGANGTNGVNGYENRGVGPGGAGGGQTSPEPRFDPNFTQNVIDAMGPKTTPRNRRVFSSLIRHLHDHIREVELSVEEWQASIKFINWVGAIYAATDHSRNEAHRITDILGVESLVDQIAHAQPIGDGDSDSDCDCDSDPTSSAILGPFWSPDAPFRENGSSILQDGVPASGRVALMHGVIRDSATGQAIAGAVLDIWQASANGKYDFQDREKQTPNNLRGKFRADRQGRYSLYCLHPTAYSLPRDGPSWELLRLMDRHAMRPAHIHLKVTHPDYRGLTTQLYPRDDPYLATDTVFAVKKDLILAFKPRHGDPKATLEIEYDVKLAPAGHRAKLPQGSAVGCASMCLEDPA